MQFLFTKNAQAHKISRLPSKTFGLLGQTSGLLRKTKSKNRALALRRRLGVSPNIQSSGLNIDGEGHGSGVVGSCNFCSQKMHNMAASLYLALHTF